MDPELPTPRFNPEQLPPPPRYEQGPDLLPPTPEAGIEIRGEKQERQAEAQPMASQPSPVPVLPTPVVPQVSDPVVDDSALQQDDVPLIANDDDLIEKEWVDKAKAIISETKDDPYRREQEVSRLQIEYLRKRYGREVGESQ